MTADLQAIAIEQRWRLRARAQSLARVPLTSSTNESRADPGSFVLVAGLEKAPISAVGHVLGRAN